MLPTPRSSRFPLSKGVKDSIIIFEMLSTCEEHAGHALFRPPPGQVYTWPPCIFGPDRVWYVWNVYLSNRGNSFNTSAPQAKKLWPRRQRDTPNNQAEAGQVVDIMEGGRRRAVYFLQLLSAFSVKGQHPISDMLAQSRCNIHVPPACRLSSIVCPVPSTHMPYLYCTMYSSLCTVQ